MNTLNNFYQTIINLNEISSEHEAFWDLNADQQDTIWLREEEEKRRRLEHDTVLFIPGAPRKRYNLRNVRKSLVPPLEKNIKIYAEDITEINEVCSDIWIEWGPIKVVMMNYLILSRDMGLIRTVRFV